MIVAHLSSDCEYFCATRGRNFALCGAGAAASHHQAPQLVRFSTDGGVARWTWPFGVDCPAKLRRPDPAGGVPLGELSLDFQ